jgi:S1-C subfamily serine protease
VLKLPAHDGLLLVQMYDGAPLASAGVLGAQREDIIGNERVYTGGDLLTAVDGQPVSSIAELEMLLENNYRVGDVVTVSVIREGRTLDAPVELVEEPQ